MSKANGYILLYILFAVQPIIERYIGVFKYFDEIIVLLFFLLFILRRHKTSVTQRKLIIGICILLTVGIIGNLTSKTGQPVAAILQDVFSNIKFLLFAVSIYDITLSKKNKEKLVNGLAFFVHTLFVVMYVCAVLNLFIDIGMTDYSEGRRYGLRAFQFLFDNPAGLNTYCYFYIIIHSITLQKDGKLRRYSNLFTFMGVSVWILTLRSRAIAFSVIYIFLYIYIIYFRKNNKVYRFRWYQVIVAAVLAVLLGWDAIEKYFIANDRVARYQLMYTGIEIAKQHLPLGTGFATFGTEASRAYYSPIYNQFGLSNIYGLSSSFSYYITDQYWFGILGQFGILGILLIGTMIYVIYKTIWKLSNKEKSKQLAVLTFFYTSIFASLTAGTFIQSSILPCLMIFFLLRDTDSYVKAK